MNRKTLPQIVVDPPGPIAQEYLKMSYDYLKAPAAIGFPGLVLSKGYGPMLKDVDGNIFLDFSQSVTTLGRNHPKYIQSIKLQLDNLIFQTLGSALNKPYHEFAMALKSILPSGIQDARFINCTTGTELVILVFN